MEFEVFTAGIIQQIQRTISHRRDIRNIISRYLELIDYLTSEGEATQRDYAPVKLITFPEFFLQGWDVRWDLEKYLDDIAIFIPGEEIHLLCEKAKEYSIYIAGAALEIDSEWLDRYFNTAFIIGPEGNVIHKYRKFMPATYLDEMAVSPHDMYDEYVKMYGEDITTFFPVTETKIGKIGTMICMDGNFPEIARGLALNGAEIIIRPTAYSSPLVCSPLDYWELQNRSRAWENHVYIIAPNTGGFAGDTFCPQHECPGHSMIVDYDGIVQRVMPYPGEGVISGLINLNMLRARRADVNRNLLVQLKTEVFKLIYQDPIYPINRCKKAPYKNKKDLADRGSVRPIIEEFRRKGIY